MFKKKTTHSLHTSHTPHTHNGHQGDHSHHAYMYANVYSCSFCGRKGHVSKFCYDRLNVRNNQVWVKKTNPTGPKRIWVPKSPHLIGDVGTSKSGSM